MPGGTSPDFENQSYGAPGGVFNVFLPPNPTGHDPVYAYINNSGWSSTLLHTQLTPDLGHLWMLNQLGWIVASVTTSYTNKLGIVGNGTARPQSIRESTTYTYLERDVPMFCQAMRANAAMYGASQKLGIGGRSGGTTGCLAAGLAPDMKGSYGFSDVGSTRPDFMVLRAIPMVDWTHCKQGAPPFGVHHYNSVIGDLDSVASDLHDVTPAIQDALSPLTYGFDPQFAHYDPLLAPKQARILALNRNLRLFMYAAGIPATGKFTPPYVKNVITVNHDPACSYILRERIVQNGGVFSQTGPQSRLVVATETEQWVLANAEGGTAAGLAAQYVIDETDGGETDPIQLNIVEFVQAQLAA